MIKNLLLILILQGCYGIRFDAPREDIFFPKIKRKISKKKILSFKWKRKIVSSKILEYNPFQSSSPAIDKQRGLIFIGDSRGKVHCLRQDKGELVWSFKVKGPLRTIPLYHYKSRTLYFGGDAGYFYALDTEKPSLKWKYYASKDIKARPYLKKNTIYFSDGDDQVYALNASNGNKIWKYSRPVPQGIKLLSRRGILVQGERLYAPFSDGTLVCLNIVDGSPIWEKALSTVESEEEPIIDGINTRPVIGDYIYVSLIHSGLIALDPKDGKIIWKVSESLKITSLSFGENTLVCSFEGGLLALDPRGKLLWIRRLKQGTLTEPVIYRGMIFVGHSENGLYVVNLFNGKILDQIRVGSGFHGKPGIFKNQLYILSDKGWLYKFMVARL
jgi:outer membrane protein assembly factor BamB